MAAGAAARPAPATRAGAAQPRPAPARRPQRRPARPPRRMSGAAARAAARGGGVALPRVFDAPFARSLRARTSGVMGALLAGRGWIILIGVLLAGIVFFNVDLLRMNREIAANADRIAVIKRHIARDRLDVARLASTQRIQESAAQLGLVQPAPGEVRYLKARPRLDAHMAAKRVTAPNLAYVPPPPVDTVPEVPTDPAVTDPAATDPAVTDPATADPAAADPASTDPATVDPTAADPAPTAAPAG
jgi:hypothetical protein